MDGFTAKSALATGVDLIRRRPWLVALWAAMLLILLFASLVVSRAVQGWALSEAFAGRRTGSILLSSLGQGLVSLMLTSVIWASAFRAFLKPGSRPALGVGGEEFMVFGTWLVVQTIGVIVVVPLTPLMAMPLASLMISSHGPLLGREAIRLFTLPISVSVTFWGAVASVWAFARAEFAPLRSWTIARGRFWLLAGLVIGVALLDRLASMGVEELARVLTFKLPPLFAYPEPAFGVRPGLPDIRTLFEIPALVRYVLSAALQALQIVFIAGIVTSAYRASRPAPQAASVSAGSAAPAS